MYCILIAINTFHYFKWRKAPGSTPQLACSVTIHRRLVVALSKPVHIGPEQALGIRNMVVAVYLKDHKSKLTILVVQIFKMDQLKPPQKLDFDAPDLPHTWKKELY